MGDGGGGGGGGGGATGEIRIGQMLDGKVSVAKPTSSAALLFCALPPAGKVILASFGTWQP